jgi:hypothetical protein
VGQVDPRAELNYYVRQLTLPSPPLWGYEHVFPPGLEGQVPVAPRVFFLLILSYRVCAPVCRCAVSSG